MRQRNIIACSLALLFPCAAHAGILNGHASAAISGSANLVNSGLDIVLDYAVFAPGQYPGTDPSLGIDFVYAYQAFVQPASNSALLVTVGGNPGFGASGAHNPGFDLGLAAGVTPSGQSINFVSNTFVNAFTSPSIAAGQNSTVLLFTSPFTWELGNASATVTGGASASVVGEIPAPLPEPATALLLGMASIPVLRRRRR
jgi:hypothetical protein